MSKKALRASRMDLAQNALSATPTVADGSADVTRASLGTRRRTLLGGAALLTGSALPGWARAAADAAAQAGSGQAANAAGASAGSAAASGSAASPAAPAVVGTKKVPRLVLAGPFATVTNPLIRIIDAGLLADVAEKVEFVSWRTPDQLRAMALKGEADFLAMPSNLSANLYNRGLKLQQMNIGIWGILWMVARRDGLKTLADFKGQEVVMPFRGDMPDALFRLLCRKQGIDPDKDMTLRYVASPLDAMQLLITRRADNALLADPAVAVGLRKSQSFPISVVAPSLYRSVSLQEEWGRVFNRAPRMPQAGIVMLGSQLGNTALARRFEEACEEAQNWCEANPDECGQIVARRIEMLTPEGIADAIRADQSDMVVASKARPELEFFYQQLLEMQPGLVGGKLPDDGFYFAG